VSRANRIASFGSAGLLVIAGALCSALLSGLAGQLAGFVLIGLGLILATGLVFLEVGLSEDRERAREQRQRAATRRPPSRTGPTASRGGNRPSLERPRDHPHRLS
jgi:hypothetical protein